MRAVIYARFSSEKQNEASIEGQLRECKHYAKYNDIEIIGEYIDRAMTARTDHRPDFLKMIKDSYKHAFDTILVWKLDRFARNRYDAAKYRTILRQNGVKIISATEKISDGASGILFESILEGYAEYYSADLSEKVTRGMTENALKTKANGVRAPLGYYVDENNKYQIDEAMKPVIIEIFNTYNDGSTITEIVKVLEERGIKNKNYPLNYNSIYRILTNRKYIGEYKFGSVLIPHGIPAIIDEELFENIQKKMAHNKKVHAHRSTEDDYLLTSKLFCGYCGALMTGETGTSATSRKYRYYKCNRAKKHKCKKKTIRKQFIEDYVLSFVVKLLEDNNILEDLATAIFDLQTAESFSFVSLTKQLKDVEVRLNNLVTAIENGIFSKTTKERLDELEEQKEILQNKIYEESLANPLLTKDEILVALHEFKEIDTNTTKGKQKLIDSFINSIYLYDDKFIINFNYKKDSKTVSFEEINSSLENSKGSP